jgi:hypothetical protein
LKIFGSHLDRIELAIPNKVIAVKRGLFIFILLLALQTAFAHTAVELDTPTIGRIMPTKIRLAKIDAGMASQPVNQMKARPTSN